MRTVIHSPPVQAEEIASPIGGVRLQTEPTRFAVVVRALWPHKTAVELARRARCGVGTAKHWLAGERTPSVVALAVVVDEITREFR